MNSPTGTALRNGMDGVYRNAMVSANSKIELNNTLDYMDLEIYFVPLHLHRVRKNALQDIAG